MKFIVEVKETSYGRVELEANSKAEAEHLAEKEYHKGNVIWEHSEEEYDAKWFPSKGQNKTYFYFVLRGDDPMPTSYAEHEHDINALKEKFIGTWIKTGDEDHDEAQIIDIWTSYQADIYFDTKCF